MKVLLCGCGREDCFEEVTLSPKEYASLCGDPHLRAVAKGSRHLPKGCKVESVRGNCRLVRSPVALSDGRYGFGFGNPTQVFVSSGQSGEYSYHTRSKNDRERAWRNSF